MNCSHFATNTYDYITITDMFVEADGRNAGNPFQFYVSRMRNAITMSPESFLIKTFDSVLEVTPDGQSILDGIIDQGFAELTAQEGQQINPADCKVVADDFTVQEYSTMRIEFKVPVPVQEGAIITIQLPDDFKLQAG